MHWIPLTYLFLACSGTPTEHHIRCVSWHLSQAHGSRRVVSVWCRPAAIPGVFIFQLAGLAGKDSECTAHLYLELHRYISDDHWHRIEWTVYSTHTPATSARATGAWMRIPAVTFHISHSTYLINSLSFMQPMPEMFWTYARTRYNSIVELILVMDDAVSGLMLISFGSNLYFVCLQLLKSIKWVSRWRMSWINHIIGTYLLFTFSVPLQHDAIGCAFSLLLLFDVIPYRSLPGRAPVRLVRQWSSSRTVASAAARAARRLHRWSVPFCQRTCNEHSGTKRTAIFQHYQETISSGMLRSRRWRWLIAAKCGPSSGPSACVACVINWLQVTGSIVTYELVLIQFHEDQKSWDCEAQHSMNWRVEWKYTLLQRRQRLAGIHICI